jgi:hypothetical protein
MRSLIFASPPFSGFWALKGPTNPGPEFRVKSIRSKVQCSEVSEFEKKQKIKKNKKEVVL